MKHKKRFIVSALILMMLISLGTQASASRWTSQYQPSIYNDTWLLKRMNCYGYGMQLYYQGYLASDESYKQQPGEFAYNSETFDSLATSYGYAGSSWFNLDAFVPDRMQEDFSTLGYSMTQVVDGSQASGTKRKIALAWGYYNIPGYGTAGDYHFYLQHEDGTWSHKPGETEVRNVSLDSEELLTNNNIATKGRQGIYTSGIKFFEISKDVVIDHPHNYGHGSNTYTPTAFLDRAGDSTDKATIFSGTLQAKLDYQGDVDYYRIYPLSTGTYTISTSASGTDLDGAVYNVSGSTIASDYSVSNFSVTVELEAFQTYYVRIYDYKSTLNHYTITF